jgi:hypothetical protein
MSKPPRFLIKGIVSLAVIGLAYYLSDLATLATWGFTIARLKTSHDLGFTPCGADPRPYLSQKFYLRDQGGQSYVFISADHQYILKFFKDMPRPWIPFSGYQQKKLGKLKRTLKGYDLAYHRLPKETGLISLHTALTSTPIPATLVDRLNIEHAVDLSSVYFILQKTADPLPKELGSESLLQIRQLLQRRASAQIADHDPRLHLNLGWVDGHPIFIDPGRFVEEANPSSDLPPKFLERLSTKE